MATESEEIYKRIRAINCSSCPVHELIGLNIPVGMMRESVELALKLIPKLKAERALAARTAELEKLLLKQGGQEKAGR